MTDLTGYQEQGNGSVPINPKEVVFTEFVDSLKMGARDPFLHHTLNPVREW